jgi:hypothetical protein
VRQLVRWGMAAVFVMATALPAMATSWDVCVDPTTDMNTSDTVSVRGVTQVEFFAAAALVYPSGTFAVSSVASPLTSCTTSATSVGRFFSRGSAVGNLPADATTSVPDIWLVEWYFRFASGGAFSTMGPVTGAAAGGTYAQTITGVFGGKTTAPGKAVITVLSTAGVDGSTVDAFQITVP